MLRNTKVTPTAAFLWKDRFKDHFGCLALPLFIQNPQPAKEDPEVPSRGSPHVQIFVIKDIWSGLYLSSTVLKAVKLVFKAALPFFTYCWKFVQIVRKC